MTWRTKANQTNIEIAGSDIKIGDVGLIDTNDVEIDPATGTLQSDVISDIRLVYSDAVIIISDAKLISANTEGVQSDAKLISTNTEGIQSDTGLIATNTSQLNAFTANNKTIADMETISISQSGAGSDIIHSDVTGSHFLIMGVQGTVSGAATVQFREYDNSPVYCGAMEVLADTPLVLPVTGFPYIASANSKGIEIVTTGDVFKGMVQFLEVDD